MRKPRKALTTMAPRKPTMKGWLNPKWPAMMPGARGDTVRIAEV